MWMHCCTTSPLAVLLLRTPWTFSVYVETPDGGEPQTTSSQLYVEMIGRNGCVTAHVVYGYVTS